MEKCLSDTSSTTLGHRTLVGAARGFAAVMLLSLCTVDSAFGQGFSFGNTKSSQLRGVIVSESEAIALSNDAFQRRAERLLRSAREPEKGRPEVLDTYVAKHTESYLLAARDALISMSGDGVLHAQEGGIGTRAFVRTARGRSGRGARGGAIRIFAATVSLAVRR